MRVSITARLFFYYLISTVLAVDQDANSDLVSRLRSANTLLDRLNLLSSDTDWVYDHNTNPKWSFTPGSVTNANGATFPAMTGTGMTIAMLNLGPCAMLPPHLHRATNIVVSVSGKTDTYMIQENGARIIKTTLTAGKQTVFPIASLHTMVNNGTCCPSRYSYLIRPTDRILSRMRTRPTRLRPQQRRPRHPQHLQQRLRPRRVDPQPPLPE